MSNTYRRAWNFLILALGLVALTFVPATAAWSATSDPARDPFQRRLAKLERSSLGPFSVDVDRGRVASLLGRFRTPGKTPAARAIHFAKKRRALFGLDRRSELFVHRYGRTGDTGFDHVVLGQRVDGVLVHGAQLTIVLDGAEVVGALGRLLASTAQAATEPRMTAAQANERGARLAPGSGAPVGDVELVLFDPALFRHDARGAARARHAYRVSFEHETVFLDAETGDLLLSEPHHEDAFDLRVLRLGDGKWWEVLDEDGTCLAPGIWAGLCDDPEQIDIADHFRTTYEYFLFEHSWHSFGNAGQQVVVYNNSSQTTNAMAWWDILGGNQFHFTDPYIGLDVAGHEFMHAVVGSTSGLPYSFETGALNESLADLFGNLVEGEIDLLANNAPKGTIRSMCSPATLEYMPGVPYPAHMDDYLELDGSDDDGGVHGNSSINNRAFCALAELLGTGAGGPTAPAVLARLGRMAFGANQMLPSSSGFDSMRAAMLVMALKEPSPDPLKPLLPLCMVNEAWASVGVAAPMNDATSLVCALPFYTDSDKDYVYDDTDNCTSVVNPGQQDQDGDGVGDACDDDVDGDLVPDDEDNCPNLYNADQADADAVPPGDACDGDADDDSVPNDDDNCPEDANVDQTDSDDDGDGDACDPDEDADGVWGINTDNCPYDFNPGQEDQDDDGIGDACDPCTGVANDVSGWSAGIPEADIAPAPLYDDDDADGVPDECDRYPTSRGRVTIDGNPGTGRLIADGVARDLEVDTDGTFASIPIQLCAPPCRDPKREEDPVEIVIENLSAGAKVIVADERGRPVGSLAPLDRDGSIEVRPRAGVRHRLYVASGASTASVRVAAGAARD